jgi:hypothetical protein
MDPVGPKVDLGPNIGKEPPAEDDVELEKAAELLKKVGS